LAQVEDTGEVDVNDPLPARLVDLHRLHGLGDARIVEKDIHLPKSRDGGLRGLLARFEVCHVAADAEMIRPEFRSRVLGALLIEVENGDLRAVLGEETGGCEPDSARAGRTGNDGSLAFQQHRFLQ
jgi:hypothetical protein